tara:strand:+ start:3709 stop:4968 length:1260 start_codon:yes stop_codon:yes gene_type:complete
LLFEKNKNLKLIFLGIVSAYFYFLDNGELLVILIFLAILTKLQVEKNIFNNFIFTFLLLTPLFVFKYSYIIYSLFNLKIPEMINNNFPVGLSFFTFQAIAYYFDKNRLQSNESGFEIFTFLAFFPQLLAGPIVNIKTFRTGINKPASNDDIIQGIYRTSIGLLKKYFLADTLAEIILIYNNYQDISNISFMSSFLLIFSYTFQIYFDFSGYCDIAIGLGKFFGFTLPENFNRPYLAKSFQEFWQRWHITLSTFFKQYVYIRLGGNRISNFKTYRNLWITFFCTALWHGSSLTFLLWGFIHGFIMTVEKVINFHKLFSNRVITMLLISLSWVPFFAKTIGDTLYIYKGLMNYNFQNDTLLPLLFQNLDFRFIVVVLCCIISLKRFQFEFKPTYLSSFTIFFIALIVVLSSSVDPFIYFKF